MLTILHCLKPFINNGVWYGSDVDTLGDNLKIENLMNEFPRKIGTTEELLHLAENVHQFQSGVFILMPKDYGEQLDIEYYTEDEPFRDLGDAILEIRTFDTSFFLVYSNDLQVIDTLSKEFGCKIYHKDDANK